MLPSSEYFPDTKFLYLVTVFENEGVLGNTTESVFLNFLWGIVVQSVEKSKDVMFVTWLKVGDLRCSKNSSEFLRIHIWLIPLLE